MSQIYLGAKTYKAFYINSTRKIVNLNITRYQMGNQCRLINVDVIWSNLGTQQTTRAVAFTTPCNQSC